MIDLGEWHALFRNSHAAVGVAGVVLFWVPVFARKGGRLHTRFGRLFAWCAYYVGITGLASSAWGVVHPASFLASSEFEGLDAESRRRVVENARFILSITGFLALAVLSSVVMGTRVMRAGERHHEVGGPLMVALSAAFLAWSAALLAWGAATLTASVAGWDALAGQSTGRAWVCVALGAYGAYGAIGDLRYVRGPRPSASERRALHIECMIGAGSGFHAAFFLFGASRVLDLDGAAQLVLTIAPLVVGGVATSVWVRRDAKRFEPAPGSV